MYHAVTRSVGPRNGSSCGLYTQWATQSETHARTHTHIRARNGLRTYDFIAEVPLLYTLKRLTNENGTICSWF